MKAGKKQPDRQEEAQDCEEGNHYAGQQISCHSLTRIDGRGHGEQLQVALVVLGHPYLRAEVLIADLHYAHHQYPRNHETQV